MHDYIIGRSYSCCAVSGQCRRLAGQSDGEFMCSPVFIGRTFVESWYKNVIKVLVCNIAENNYHLSILAVYFVQNVQIHLALVSHQHNTVQSGLPMVIVRIIWLLWSANIRKASTHTHTHIICHNMDV